MLVAEIINFFPGFWILKSYLREILSNIVGTIFMGFQKSLWIRANRFCIEFVVVAVDA